MAEPDTSAARLTSRLERLRYWRTACAVEGEAMARHFSRDGCAGDPATLVYFHGDWESGGHYVRRLSRQSGIGMLSFSPHGARGDVVPATIEEMARERLPGILAAQPHGAFRIAGYCNGALVAYEVARQLLDAGRDVGIVILIEPPSLNMRQGFRRLARVAALVLAPGGRRTGAGERRIGAVMGSAWKLRRGIGLSLRQAMTLLARKLPKFGPTRLRGLQTGSSVDSGESMIRCRHAALTSAYTRAVAAYLPPPIPVRTVVLSSGLDESDRRSVWYDCSGWARLEQRPTIMPLPGNHLSCIGEHLSNLAECLRLLIPREGSPIVSSRPPAEASLFQDEPSCGSAGFGGRVLAECPGVRLPGAIADNDVRRPHESDDSGRRAGAEGCADESRDYAEGP
jgi:thioesterase domain-containing protein